MITSVRHSTLRLRHKSMLLKLSVSSRDTKVTSDEPNNALVWCCTYPFPVRHILSILCKCPDEEMHRYDSIMLAVSPQCNKQEYADRKLSTVKIHYGYCTVDVLLVEKYFCGITSYNSANVCLFLLKSPCTQEQIVALHIWPGLYSVYFS